jgi:hypothetical protein
MSRGLAVPWPAAGEEATMAARNAAGACQEKVFK